MKTTIITPTPHLPSSLDFYQKLNFKVVANQSHGIVTDGIAVIEILPDHFVRPGIKLYDFDWRTLTITAPTFDYQQGKAIRDPNGVWIYLSDKHFEPDFPASAISFGHTGNFSGISIETDAIPNSITFWRNLGFEIVGGNEAHGYVTLANKDNFQVSFMKPFVCPHLFFNPSMNFFNHGENLQKIQKIKESGIKLTESITVFNPAGIADNVIIRDPGGYGFFVFND